MAIRKKQGFVFTVLALAILVLIMLSMALWVRTFEQGEIRASERFKGEAVRSIMNAVSDESITKFANSSAYYATYQLVGYSFNRDTRIAQSPAPDYLGIPADCADRAAVSSYPENNCTRNVELYAKALMENGSLPSSVAQASQFYYNESENDSYTLKSWREKVSTSANMMGFNVTFSPVRNFTYKQVDAWHVQVYFEMNMDLSDMEHTMRQSKTLRANATFPIEGFEDPMITRNEMKIHSGTSGTDVPIKQMWRNGNYLTTQDVRPILVADNEGSDDERMAMYGVGWFFGPIETCLYDTTLPENPLQPGGCPPGISQSVLVTSNATSAYPVADFYGAILLTVQPNVLHGQEHSNGCNYNTTYQENCLNCLKWWETNVPGCTNRGPEVYDKKVNLPVSVVTNWGTAAIPTVHRAGATPENQQFILLDNEHPAGGASPQMGDGYHRVWDITRLRDMEICGFYVHDTVRPAPSFFQRMLLGAPNPQYASLPLGIESFVAGQWAGGKIDFESGQAAMDSRSKLDFEFYSSSPPASYKIKGMPGCKYEDMCKLSNTNATEVGIGKFRLGSESSFRYGAESIAYSDDGTAPSLPDDEST